MTFPDIETNAQSPVNLTRQKRQLAEQAIAQAATAQWTDAAATNRKLLELGPDVEAENRLAKSLWELGDAVRGARALPDRPGPRPDQPHRRAEHRPAQGPPPHRRREDRPGPGGQQGPGQHLRRGDRQDRLRVPDRPRRRRRSSPRSTRATRSSSRPRATGSSPTATASASAWSSRASRPACSSSWPTATSTPPA